VPVELRLDIREYREADEAAVIALWRECDLVVPWNDPGKDIARKLAAGREFFLVGCNGDRVIASIMGGYEGHRGWINYLAVSPSMRRHGHGEALVREVEERLRRAGCPKVNLQVRATNSEVIAFYEAVGYARDEVVSLGKRLIYDQ
jgi:ribosomal protein S18 acetylase RimI-like enzyme